MRLSENRDKSKLLGLFTLSNVLTFLPFDFLTRASARPTFHPYSGIEPQEEENADQST